MDKPSVTAIREAGRDEIYHRFGLRLTAEDFEVLRQRLRKIDEAERRACQTAG